MTLTRQERRRQKKKNGADAQNVDAQLVSALRQQAGMAYQAGQLGKAQELLDQILHITPNDAAALGPAALIAHGLGQKDVALTYLGAQRKALDRGEASIEAYRGLAGLLSQLDAHGEAEIALRRAIKRWPHDAALLTHYAEIANKVGKLERASDAARRATSLMPGLGDAWHQLGLAEQKSGRTDDAVAAYRQALVLAPKDRFTLNNLGAALLADGRADEALAHCEAWLDWSPRDIEALAMKGHILQEMERSAEAAYLFDFDKFVRGKTVNVPEGYDSLEEFNTALVNHILAHQNLEVPDPSNPRYHHPSLSIAMEMLSGEKGPVGDLEKLMRAAVDDYLATLPDDPDHPFVHQMPTDYSLYAWAAVLNQEGNLDPHVHKDGFLSGCYYIQIPDEITAHENGSDGDVAGGFEVGRPPQELGCKKDHMRRQYKPYDGYMLLFPAYFYHCTIPFRSTEKRICIAFDVMPA